MCDKFTFEDAKRDVIKYLSKQSDDYFAARDTTRQAVLSNEAIIDRLASEHHKCVCSFGCDRVWSCRDACDDVPGLH